MILTFTTLRFLSQDSLGTLRYITLHYYIITLHYITLKRQLIFILLRLFYLCDNAHIVRGISFTFTHTHTKEKLQTTPDEGTRQDCRNVGSMNCNFLGYIH